MFEQLSTIKSSVIIKSRIIMIHHNWIRSVLVKQRECQWLKSVFDRPSAGTINTSLNSFTSFWVKFAFWFVSRSRKWPENSFRLNRVQMYNASSPCRYAHDATVSVRWWWRRDGNDDGDGCTSLTTASMENGASITAFDIIIAGGDLGASRLIDYNMPHIL